MKLMKYLLNSILQNIYLLKCYLYAVFITLIQGPSPAMSLAISDVQCVWAEMPLATKLSQY